MTTHDLTRELSEIREQLSYTKRVGFLFGAGTSKSMGLPDITDLTKGIEDKLNDNDAVIYKKLTALLHDNFKHIEGILNLIRLIRKLTNDDTENSYMGISGTQAKKLDKNICDIIYDIIIEKEESADFGTAKNFIKWLSHLPRDFAKEIFTTNYDLIIEKSFESLLIPYFDGFVGSHEPFFAHENLEPKTANDSLPLSWIRLWKLHGSLGWFWKTSAGDIPDRVIRLSAGSKKEYPDSELVIYPSRDKYESSRKQPFTSYFDKLKNFLVNGEGIFIISGYSFSDDHINELIYSCLTENNRLHIIAFFYDDKPLEKIVKEHRNFSNFTMIGYKKASISGVYGEWGEVSNDPLVDPFWDSSQKSVSLGDYTKLVEFLTLCSGKSDK